MRQFTVTLFLLAAFPAGLYAQPATISFDNLQVVLNPCRGDTSPIKANVSGGSATFNISDSSCPTPITGTVTFTFPTGPLTGAPGMPPAGVIGGDRGTTFALTSPPGVDVSLTQSVNVEGMQGWTVFTNLASNYGRGQFPACEGTNVPTVQCSLPYLFYGDDFLANGVSKPYVNAELRVISDSGASADIFIVAYFSGTAAGGIDHMEVVQAIQDAKNSVVPLIPGKPTIVRGFVTLPQPVPNVTGSLHGFHGGTELSGSPLSPKATITPPATVDRTNYAQSLNFMLPDDWITEGTLDLRLDLSLPSGATIPGSNPNTSVSGTFAVTNPRPNGRKTFTIGYLTYCYAPPGGVKTCANGASVSQHDSVLRKIYPMAPDNITYVEMNVPEAQRTWTGVLAKDEDVDAFLAQMRKFYDASVGIPYDQLVSWFPEQITNELLGDSDPKWIGWFFTGTGRVTWMQDITVNYTAANFLSGTAAGINSHTLPHEIGHNLGFRHPSKPASNGAGCGGIADKDSKWPYANCNIQEVGMDPASMTVVPSTAADVMAYCDQNGITTWIAPFTYLRMITNKLEPSRGMEPARGPLARDAGSSDQIVISGWIRQDGSAASLDPVYHVPVDPNIPASLSGGTHCLHYAGAGGALGDYCFSPPFQDPESMRPLDTEYFSVKAPFFAGTTRLSLMAGARELAALTATSAPPVLTITAPKAGDVWSGGMRTISWTASDPDGKPLIYSVLYSADGGQTWVPAILDIKDPQFTFDPSQIDGGNNVKFRVMASDGLNSTSADVGPLQVQQTPALALGQPTLDFGSQAIGQVAEQSLNISNNGTGPAMVTSASIDNQAFRIVSGNGGLTIPAGQSRAIKVDWAVSSAGAQTGTLTLASTDPAHANLRVALTGNGVNGTTDGCSFTLSATSDAPPAAGDMKTVTLTANVQTCTWTASSNVNWIAITGSPNGTGNGQVTYQVGMNNVSSSRTGTLTIAGMPYTVTQAAGSGSATMVVQVDGGAFTQAIGYPRGLTGAYFVNRLTPPAYPATLQNVQIYFGNRSDGLAQGTAITVVTGTAGGSSIDGVKLAMSPATVGTTGAFNTYTVSPLTITSGDFVVGFMVNNPVGILPADEDISTRSQQRSYASSTGGATFTLLDSLPGLGGNLGIRASVSTGQ